MLFCLLIFLILLFFFGGKCPYACMYMYGPTFLFIFKAFQDGSAVVCLHAVCLFYLPLFYSSPSYTCRSDGTLLVKS